MNCATVRPASLPVMFGKEAAPGSMSLILANAADMHAETEEGKDSIHQKLAGLFSQAQDRLEAVGGDSSFG